MGILQKHYDQIKTEFEKDNGWLLRLHFTNKKHLIKEFLPEYPYKQSIGFHAQSFQWYEFSTLTTEREDVYIIKASFVTVGDLILYDNHRESSRRQITIDITAKITCTYYAESDAIAYLREHFEILTGQEKKIDSFDGIVLKEFQKLTMLQVLNTGLYDQTWPFNEPNNKTHDFISSMHYYNELENMNRQAKYFIALANTYAPFANNYFPTVESTPWIHYPINFTSHDRRYLDYCASAIQSMYVYWERLALLIYQYYKPAKVSDGNLSFVKLIRNIVKEQHSSTIDFTWFIDFLDNDHSRLQLLRHPLVHFKMDPVNHKGSYIPMIHTRWMSNIQNKAELDQLQEASKKLINEIIDLAKKCYEGYEKAIQLIIALKSTSIT